MSNMKKVQFSYGYCAAMEPQWLLDPGCIVTVLHLIVEPRGMPGDYERAYSTLHLEMRNSTPYMTSCK